MNKKYVTNLGISKRLKELGVKQESDFYWKIYKNYIGLVDKYAKEGSSREHVSAFHVSELVEKLPESIEIPDEDMACYLLRISKNPMGNNHKVCSYFVYYIQQHTSYIMFDEGTLANALGLMLRHLLKSEIINVGDL